MKTKNQRLRPKANPPMAENANSYTLTIAWLYPDLMSTYGDRGNIITLQKRCEWRGIKVNIERVSLDTKYQILNTCDLFFMGGAQDTQQEIVNKDLFEKKGKILQEKIENGTPGLFICGAYQFLGKYYKTAEGKILPGLEILPLYTENPGKERLIGNIMIHTSSNILRARLGGGEVTNESSLTALPRSNSNVLVGFENHGGRTYLDDPNMAFAKVIKGYGNNGTDRTEGILYKNTIGTYLHGPILPKNPEIADFLIKKALEVKYKKEISLKKLDDMLESKAREVIVNRLKNS